MRQRTPCGWRAICHARAEHMMNGYARCPQPHKWYGTDENSEAMLADSHVNYMRSAHSIWMSILLVAAAPWFLYLGSEPATGCRSDQGAGAETGACSPLASIAGLTITPNAPPSWVSILLRSAGCWFFFAFIMCFASAMSGCVWMCGDPTGLAADYSQAVPIITIGNDGIIIPDYPLALTSNNSQCDALGRLAASCTSLPYIQYLLGAVHFVIAALMASRIEPLLFGNRRIPSAYFGTCRQGAVTIVIPR